VQLFESERFIWGGRWYHFDTMHFEYRPEFFDTSCRGNDQGAAQTLTTSADAAD